MVSGCWKQQASHVGVTGTVMSSLREKPLSPFVQFVSRRPPSARTVLPWERAPQCVFTAVPRAWFLCLALCSWGEAQSPRGLLWPSSTPSSPPPAASLTFRSHVCRGKNLIRSCVGIASQKEQGLKCCSGESRRHLCG